MIVLDRVKLLIHILTGIFSGFIYFYMFKIPTLEVVTVMIYHAIVGSIVGYLYYWYVFSVRKDKENSDSIKLSYYACISMGMTIMFLESVYGSTSLISIYLIFISIVGILCMSVRCLFDRFNYGE